MALLDDLFNALQNAQTPWAKGMMQQMVTGFPGDDPARAPQPTPMPRPVAPAPRSAAPAVAAPATTQIAINPAMNGSIGGRAVLSPPSAPAGAALSTVAPAPAPQQRQDAPASLSPSDLFRGDSGAAFLRGAGKSSSLLGALFNGFGEVSDEQKRSAQTNATFQALRSAGLNDAQAYLAVTNPEVMKQVVPALFGGQSAGVKPTDEIREYNFAKQQGYGGSFMDYKRDMKMAGKPPIEHLTTGEKAVDKVYAKEYENLVVSGGFADAEKGLAQLREVSKALKDPKGSNLTGPVLGRVPDFVTAFTHPDALATRDAVQEVVQRNLRAILGAQFTEKEGERLISRAYNPALSEAENSKRIDRLASSMEKALRAKRAAADYYEQHGSLSGYKGAYQFSTDDILADVEAGVPGEASSAPKSSLAATAPKPTADASPPVDGARQAADGNWYVADPARPGKYLRVNPATQEQVY